METTADRIRSHRGAALFSFGFRPFFLFASIWAALAAPLWALAYLQLAPAAFATREWHTHEMLFGYLAGVVAGFLLTAVPNWTGRLPVVGAPLAALFGLWVAGRLAMLTAGALGVWAGVVDSLFLVALALVISREVLAGRNARNLVVCVLVSLLAAANIAFHLRAPAPDAVWLGERIALAAAALLVALIGGRITPSFTRNWMAKHKLAPLPAPVDRFDMLVLVVTAAALVAWLASPLSALAGAALCAAGLGALVRLARWRGWRTFGEPIVLILHVGYLWLGVALTLMGLSALAPAVVTPSAGIHALTAGAVGVMTLAVMTRATRGHTGRALAAPWGTQLIYALVNLGALARVVGGMAPQLYAPSLLTSAILWGAAFALFALVYGPMLALRRPAAAAA